MTEVRTLLDLFELISELDTKGPIEVIVSDECLWRLHGQVSHKFRHLSPGKSDMTSALVLNGTVFIHGPHTPER